MNEYMIYNTTLPDGFTPLLAHGYRTEDGVHSFFIREKDEEGILHNNIYHEFPVEGTIIFLKLKGETKQDD